MLLVKHEEEKASACLIDFGFDDDGFRRAIWIRAKIEKLGLKLYRIEQGIQVLACRSRYLHTLYIAAKLFEDDSVLEQLTFHLSTPEFSVTCHTIDAHTQRTLLGFADSFSILLMATRTGMPA